MDTQKALEVLIEEVARLRAVLDAAAGTIQKSPVKEKSGKWLITEEGWSELVNTCEAVHLENYKMEIRQKIRDASGKP